MNKEQTRQVRKAIDAWMVQVMSERGLIPTAVYDALAILQAAYAEDEAERVATITVNRFRGHLGNYEVDYFGDLPDGTYPLYTQPINQLDEIANVLHYPDCWDTAAYPTLVSAIHEVWGSCTNEDCPQPSKRCPYCDGTGDVHSIDGQWRGKCDCKDTQPIKPDVLASSIEELAHSDAGPTVRLTQPSKPPGSRCLSTENERLKLRITKLEGVLHDDMDLLHESYDHLKKLDYQPVLCVKLKERLESLDEK